LSIVYVLFGKVSWVTAFFDGLKPAVIAIVILALFKIGKKSLLSKTHYFIAIIAFVCIFFFKIQFPIIIFGVIIFALILRYFFPNLFRSKITSQRTNNDEEETYIINRFSQIPNAGFNPLKIFKQVAIALVLWSLPMLTFYFFLSDFQFWRNLSFFFTKAAFVTFGGAYAVLPYVAQVSVEKFNWLSNLEMIDGLALGETTPGPLIMILVYVGFMAGYNHFEGSILMGSAGLLMTSFYTFLPSFLFILIGAPIVERTQENERIKEILSLITAAVFGIILNLILFFSKAVFCEQKQFSINSVDYISLIWTFVSVFALTRLKINMILWIVASGVFGIINYLIFNG
jgi:chromate transporter